jgi:hypothetical protein
VQVFGSFPTEISKFLCLGDIYVPTDPATGQLWTRGFGHIKEHVKQCLALGGGPFPWSSWHISHTNFEIFGVWGTICAHGSTHRLDIQTGVGASEGACQTVY